VFIQKGSQDGYQLRDLLSVFLFSLDIVLIWTHLTYQGLLGLVDLANGMRALLAMGYNSNPNSGTHRTGLSAVLKVTDHRMV
jgi:hypothetical protein